MVVTDDDQLAARCRSLRNLCFQAERRFYHEELGWNFRFSNLQAAIGLAQLERLDEFVDRKRAMGHRYTALLEAEDRLQLPLAKTDYADNIYWVYGVVLDRAIGLNAVQAMQRLRKHAIGCRPFFWPMHLQPVFLDRGLFNNEHHPVAECLAEYGFYLPSGLALTEEQIRRVAEATQVILNE